MISHDTLLRMIAFKGKLVTTSPIHVGAGRAAEPGAIDLTFIRISHAGVHEPYIPGSSLKGILRSTSEALVNALGMQDKGIWACDPLSRQNNCGALLRRVCEDLLAKGAAKQDVVKQVVNKLCIACQIYGSTIFGSPLSVYDAYPFINDSGKPTYELGVKAGIAIGRDTGAVARGALYHVEYVTPGSEFNLGATAKNLPNYLVGLIATTITEINAGRTLIGGQKSRGMGQVKMMFSEVEVSAGYRGDENILEAMPHVPEDIPVKVPLKPSVEKPTNADLELFTRSVLESFAGAWRRYVSSKAATI